MKKCDICGVREATLKVRQLGEGGKPVELEVCAECARERGLTGTTELKPTVAEEFARARRGVGQEDEQLVCTGCGMTFAEFKRLGRLGCADCYAGFQDKLEPLIRRVQGAVRHVGRTPGRGPDAARAKLAVRQLRAELDQAIKGEDYERAADLRDKLNRAEKDAGS
ncbi:UvrB/UvrC motif-containing protein [candidate division WOR-3 bacterium]|nr:UvrB/UvrC motif-containing protein [candidate division WOR-3 bacterium]